MSAPWRNQHGNTTFLLLFKTLVNQVLTQIKFMIYSSMFLKPLRFVCLVSKTSLLSPRPNKADRLKLFQEPANIFLNNTIKIRIENPSLSAFLEEISVDCSVWFAEAQNFLLLLVSLFICHVHTLFSIDIIKLWQVSSINFVNFSDSKLCIFERDFVWLVSMKSCSF